MNIPDIGQVVRFRSVNGIEGTGMVATIDKDNKLFPGGVAIGVAQRSVQDERSDESVRHWVKVSDWMVASNEEREAVHIRFSQLDEELKANSVLTTFSKTMEASGA